MNVLRDNENFNSTTDSGKLNVTAPLTPSASIGKNLQSRARRSSDLNLNNTTAFASSVDDNSVFTK